jgi:phosphatidylglycerol:prolipoprotein diacylglycerol transferase
MHPILLQGSPLGDINSYGTLLLLGGLSILPGLWWDRRQRGLPAEFHVDLYLVILLGCFIGGRLLDVLTRPEEFLADPARIFALRDAFIFYGSLLGVFAGFGVLARRYRRGVGELCDLLSPYIGFGHALGRVGCYLVGCCYGAPVVGDPAWSAHFPPGSIAYDAAELPPHQATTVGLHPVQLYEAAGLLLIATVLVVLRVRRGVEAPWRATARYTIAYGLLRLLTELFRGDLSRGLYLHLESPALAAMLRLPADQQILLSTSQMISALMIGWGLWVLHRRAPSPPLSSASPA